jgi:peptidoglycan hydrolase-like protein with peptidoglycan-binding domain
MVTVIYKGSPNFYPQNGVKKLFITDHWMVGTLGSTDGVFASTARKASATYGVGESEIHQYVNEKDYPFSDGNTYANQHTISIEHEGGWLQADGTRKTPSAAVCELSAQLHADIARRHGFGKLVIGVNVFPHNHWVATACPGTLGIQWIVDRANQINGEGGAPLGGINGGSSVALGWNASSWSTKQIQTALIKLGYNLGATGADNDYGILTTKAVHQLEVDHGLSVDVGIAGPQVVGLLAKLTGNAAPVAQSNKLVVDGNWGVLTTKAEQRALGVDPDGIRGYDTIGAEQLRTGAHVDHIDGPDTREHLQLRLKALGFYKGKIDKIVGPQTVRALQEALNAGLF